MKVKRAMHKGAMWISPETPILEIAKTMQEHDNGALPVGENDRLVGMVTDRDIVCRGIAGGKDLSKLKARDVVTKGITYCREEHEIHEALNLMQKHKRIG